MNEVPVTEKIANEVWSATNPKPVELDADEQKALRRLSDRQVAVQQFVQTVQKQGEQRLEQLQVEGREVWTALAKKHGLDLKKVDYGVSEDGTKLVPVVVRL